MELPSPGLLRDLVFRSLKPSTPEALRVQGFRVPSMLLLVDEQEGELTHYSSFHFIFHFLFHLILHYWDIIIPNIPIIVVSILFSIIPIQPVFQLIEDLMAARTLDSQRVWGLGTFCGSFLYLLVCSSIGSTCCTDT